jgi:rfaE bifunctional protein nucleotidyltransferase chain/domain
MKISRLKKILAQLQAQGKKMVFTNGCFDILHVGHVRYLRKAKSLGDILIIGMNTDRSVKTIKGEKRPIVPQEERAEILSALAFVDYVVFFDEPDPYDLIVALKPDVLVKGADWSQDLIIGREVVENLGGRVVRIPMVPGASSTGLIEKIIRVYGKGEKKSGRPVSPSHPPAPKRLRRHLPTEIPR